MERQSWDAYFLSIAQQVSTRSTCTRKAVGCVLTVDRRIIATGYNGALPRQPHCGEVGCLIAEVLYPPKNDVEALALCRHDILERDCRDVTASPCLPCMMHLTAARIVEVVYTEAYRLELTMPIADASGVILRQATP